MILRQLKNSQKRRLGGIPKTALFMMEVGKCFHGIEALSAQRGDDSQNAV